LDVVTHGIERDILKENGFRRVLQVFFLKRENKKTGLLFEGGD
jgi:hypothetical protein